MAGPLSEVRKRVLAGKGNRVPLLAEETDTSVSALYARIKRGEVKAYRLGKSVIVPAEEAARILGMELPLGRPEAA